MLSDSLCFTDFLIIKCFLLYRVHDISKDFAFIITIRFDDSYYQGEVPLEAYECLYSSGYTFAIMEAQTGHPAGTGIYNPCALFLVFLLQLIVFQTSRTTTKTLLQQEFPLWIFTYSRITARVHGIK